MAATTATMKNARAHASIRSTSCGAGWTAVSKVVCLECISDGLVDARLVQVLLAILHPGVAARATRATTAADVAPAIASGKQHGTHMWFAQRFGHAGKYGGTFHRLTPLRTSGDCTS